MRFDLATTLEIADLSRSVDHWRGKASTARRMGCEPLAAGFDVLAEEMEHLRDRKMSLAMPLMPCEVQMGAEP